MNQEEIVVEIRNLRKVFRTPFSRKHITALGSLNLDIYKNEIFGYLGPSGSGKSTTIKLLIGIQTSTSGTAWILGKRISDININDVVGYLPEYPVLYNHLTGLEFLVFMGRFFNLSKNEATERANRLIQKMGLAKMKDKRLHRYSRSMKQRIGVAQALMNDPKVLFLDEPMAGLDPVGVKELKEVLLELKDQKKTIFYSSHVFHDVETICDRVGILSEGRLVEVGRINELLKTRVSPIEIAVEKLGKEGFAKINKIAKRTIKQECNYRFFFAEDDEAQIALKIINETGAKLNSYIPHRLSLDEYFLPK